MPTQNLLYQRYIPINDQISITIPTIGEILDDEDNYYNLVFSLTAMPIDMMVQLDDLGINFAEINEYELFLLLFSALKTQDTHLVFGDLNMSNLEMAISAQNGQLMLVDKTNDVCIDRAIHGRIADTLRMIHHLEKNTKKPANGPARDFMLERARAKQKRERRKKRRSQLETLIISMVNTEQFKYNFESVKELTIYQFNESVHQIMKKIDYDNRMYGVYAGTVNAKELKPEDLTWLSNK